MNIKNKSVVLTVLVLFISFVIYHQNNNNHLTFINYIFNTTTTMTTTTATTSKYLFDRGDRLVLPDNVVPKSYNLHLYPNIKAFTFRGQVDITLQVNKPTTTIVIHSIEIAIQSATINNNNKAINIEYDTTDEVAVLTFEKEVSPSDSAVLAIAFTGELNDKLKGFYRSKYVVNGEDRYVATTQFEATDARRAFPCFDEPALKAEFYITITTEKHLTALSNQPEVSLTDNADGTHTYVFEKTPRMSTYIVAFVVGEFDYVEGFTKSGVRTRIYQSIGKEEKGDFALDVAIRALDFFEEYFEIPFPLKKCDHIAIGSFTFGAMENFGLITYRESILLTSPQTTLRTKQRITEVIGHELAHQWFGNLVTMEWWSQLWLNEGFATYMGVLVTDHLFPEWNDWLDFSEIYRNGALGLDALENSHPIEVPVHNSAQINEIFDAISYNKGACVIQMVATRYGDAFRQGLNHYLTKFKYQNTNTEDLWDSISLKANDNVKDFVDAYTKKAGYPVVSFTRSQGSCCSYHVSQRQFRFTETADVSKDPIWKCHIQVETRDKQSQEIMLDSREKDVTINVKEGEWFKPNYKQTGYYRIQYDQSIIDLLLPAIKSLELPAADRLGLLSDANALSKALQTPLSVFMDLVSAFENENEFSIWSFIMDRLSVLLAITEDQPYHQQLEKFVVKLLTPLSTKLGFESVKGESSSDVLLREKVNTRLGLLGYAPIVEESKKRFAKHLDGSSPLTADVRAVVLHTVVRNGDEAVQDQVIELYKKAKVVAEKNSYLQTIGLNRSPSGVEKALKFSLTEFVNMQDTFIVWSGVGHAQRSHTWKYFVDNFKSINDRFKESGLFGRIITSTLAYRLSDQQIEIAEKFLLKDNAIPIAHRSILQDIESIKTNGKWFESFNNDLSQWLNKQNL
ncbi:puromycin-sensitive aminopeptidase-like protein [Cavenderia fasciculata]|uniref:Aminopeptidase n=1 Tax=Cavenderia fasciculata TaxID=261658 RepID=F4PJG3_CACFS|nr:puromycin-sensitive aminopeptidase-like protein [Cavenderia fasciculata]EGG24449.1 puromycin-sensitive aminopeptidase-like protein [Cavenderia fasciculata]|eukprot:XP_004362300.1 puromycin-sensitive aminopeptidase-like protein [Cavenderia fasciculata]